MVASGGKSQVSAAAPPRTLNVRKFAESRASELEALHSVVASRSNNDFKSQRNKRRRTTSHDDRIARNKKGRKKPKLVAAGVAVVGGSGDNGAVEKDDVKKLPRRVRRRIELIKNARSEIGFSTSGDGTKRLRTHVWHAKRFTMTKLWGFHLPLCKQGRGRGSRALLKKLKQGVLVRDASYYRTLQLEGPEDLLLTILGKVLEPCPSMPGDLTSQKILSGETCGRGILHHVGALSSQTVAPVTYIWRPHCVNNDTESQNFDVFEKHEKVVSSTSIRQLWIWLHPAALGEGYEILKSACEMAKSPESSINCFLLEDKLAKLEVIGFGAFKLIQKILRPAARRASHCILENHWALQKCSAAGVIDEASTCLYELKNEEEISDLMVISLVVSDPRYLVAKEHVDASEIPYRIPGSGDAEMLEKPTLSGISEGKPEIMSSSCLGLKKSNIPQLVDLWDTRKCVDPPVAEDVLCMERHLQRMKFFCIPERKSSELNASEEKSSPLCPIMLMKNNVRESSITRWSIILPLSWLKVFWDAAVSNGAQAIGMKERRWIACDVGLASFPSDFPDSNAYSCFKTMESAVADQKAKQCPPSSSCFKVPVLLPWNCIRCSLHRTFQAAPTRLEPLISDSMKNLKCEKCDTEVMCCHSDLFDGYVARTSSMLAHFLSQIGGDHLLLFPNVPDGKRNLLKIMKNEKAISQQTNEVVGHQIKCVSKLCFLRVVLHAFREGVFEEGAVVCAPHFTDISLWKNSTEDDGGKLQIPDSLLQTYFVQRQSGKWELEVPEASEARNFFRWPIGFITTGFVRGCKKPTAVALCETTSLAYLREEQWKSVPVKQRRKEIYVLVRNLRSTAYRLALATIVLEVQEEDMEYM